MAQFDSDIGARVRCKDKRCGQLLKVVADSYTQRVTDLIVEREIGAKAALVVPVSAVERATEKEVRLSVGSDELDNFVEYREEDFTAPPPGWQDKSGYGSDQVVRAVCPCGCGMPYSGAHPQPVIPLIRYPVPEDISPDLNVLGRGTRVNGAEGPLGIVDHVLVDEKTGKICELVVDRGFHSQSLLVPISVLQRVTEDSIFIEASERQLRQLPQCTCRAASDIVAEVQDRLEAAGFDASQVRAELKEGVLRLSGVVWDVASKRHAEATARSIEGVIEVENLLDTNAAIIARVSHAVMADPRTEVAVVEVISEQGMVTLQGRVDTPKIRQAAEEIASKQPGVVVVINALEVGRDEHTESLKFRLAALMALGEIEYLSGDGAFF